MEMSVVIPVYNSADILPELAERLAAALESMIPSGSFEVVMVNDGSSDQSWAGMLRIADRHPKFHMINLRKNVGQHSALLAGMRFATGAVVVLMDDDLQHEPQDIARLRAVLGPEVDVSYAAFVKKQHAWWKRWGSRFNDWTAAKLIGKPTGLRLSSFKVLKQEVVSEIIKYNGPFPYVDGLIFTVTSAAENVEIEHRERLSGRGNYGLFESLFLWTKMATNFSILPLRIASFAGVTLSILGLGAAAALTITRLIDSAGTSTPGWASILVAILVIGGVQLIALGAIGEYLGRAYVHLNGKPQYVIKDSVGFPSISAAPSRSNNAV
ncbi:undecaprenyl-phosphate 4-deoxy-4-formamido-L-arabinose transferase [Devosia sp. YR412]|uniref:glycosyltransferase family 2 protein n=1 Tax=Devosia sp. YR412 TaxID=1881030 RepID=UPI0008CB586B|nr:glycosyltransferase family 2 protein [Devosia sp. YR412]SEQ32222.1 undecaprenyl-phosphate 4-deoxy-4-formamido-L-arabinose transferase [Devosia sp. YR412]